MPRPLKRICWCGNATLDAYGGGYRACPVCHTLVSEGALEGDRHQVIDDDKDFYGKSYWLGHQSGDLNLPTIHDRARSDLADRNLYWLDAILRLRRPPADVLELGCSHGGFVALMNWAGFHATGLELSPWVAEFARRSFGVEVLVGPLEQQPLAPRSFDAIVLMDVLEHLTDPLGTMRRAAALLRNEGFLLVQTPEYRPDLDYATLVARHDRFLEMLQPEEHLYLFSRDSVQRLLATCGVGVVRYEPALFPHYDMFLAASSAPLANLDPDQVDEIFRSTPQRRMLRAMLDLRTTGRDAIERLAVADDDRTRRAEQIEELGARLRESDADRGARGAQIATLDAALRESEADRTARGEQIGKLGALLSESESDRAARLAELEGLQSRLAALRSELRSEIESANVAWRIAPKLKRRLLQLIDDASPIDPTDK